MQPAGGGIRAAAELAARVQPGHDELHAGQLGLALDVDRDAPAVVSDLGGTVRVQDHVDPRAVSGQRLVHPVVEDLPQAVLQAAAIGGPDVHAGALAHRVQALQHRQVPGGVRAVTSGVRGQPGGGGGSQGGHGRADLLPGSGPSAGLIEQSSVTCWVRGACHAAGPRKIPTGRRRMLHGAAIRVHLMERHTVPVCRRVMRPGGAQAPRISAVQVNTKRPGAVSLVAYTTRSRERRDPGMCCTER